ncbi:MAG: ATP-binding cassette domain-containing protein, partial [archaeon]|nr:ATP-binding cassette domain-containing protein [archaeon]
MALSIKKLSISIGKLDLLHDESVGIADGSKVGLIGRNGVGKTTLLKAILGQADYTGSIEFNGKAAYFSQNIELDKNKTVQETIESSATIHHQGTFDEELEEIEKKLADPKIHDDAEKLAKLMERYSDLLTKKA